MSAFKIKVAEIIDNPDGSAKIIFDVEDGFEQEIMKIQGWEKWEQEKFEQLFTTALEEYVGWKSNKAI